MQLLSARINTCTAQSHFAQHEEQKPLSGNHLLGLKKFMEKERI